MICLYSIPISTSTRSKSWGIGCWRPKGTIERRSRKSDSKRRHTNPQYSSSARKFNDTPHHFCLRSSKMISSASKKGIWRWLKKLGWTLRKTRVFSTPPTNFSPNLKGQTWKSVECGQNSRARSNTFGNCPISTKEPFNGALSPTRVNSNLCEGNSINYQLPTLRP